MVSLRAARLILTVIAVLFIGGCAASPPPLPADPAAVRAALSTPDFLPGITTAQWPDGGRSAADALSWIATDATSENDEKATAAGQSAHAVASYLAQQQLELAHIPTGPFNLRKKSLGALNPQLTQGFAHILEPFQPNLVGDATRTRGFDPLDATANDHAAARRVFAVLDTDTAAGTAFNQAAYRNAEGYLRAFGEDSVRSPQPDSTPFAYAALLYGVVAGGAELAGNSDIHVYGEQEAADIAAHTIAAARGARPGDLPAKFFTPAGVLMPPDQIPDADRIDYSEQLQLYLSRIPGIAKVILRFESLFGQGAG